MTGYVKLFSSILMSSIWDESAETRIVWVTLLALADQYGHVDGTPTGLARVAHVSPEACEAALACLLAPDQNDRSGVMEGRRILAADGGWDIVNHGTYRAKMSTDDRRERDKLRKRHTRLSARRPRTSENVRDVSHTEAEADTDQKQYVHAHAIVPPASETSDTPAERESAPPEREMSRVMRGPRVDDSFDAPAALRRLQAAYPPHRVQGGVHMVEQAFVDVVAVRGGAETSAERFAALMSNLESQKAGEQWTSEGGRYVPKLLEWLRSGQGAQRHEPAAKAPGPPAYDSEQAAAERARQARISDEWAAEQRRRATQSAELDAARVKARVGA